MKAEEIWKDEKKRDGIIKKVISYLETRYGGDFWVDTSVSRGQKYEYEDTPTLSYSGSIYLGDFTPKQLGIASHIFKECSFYVRVWLPKENSTRKGIIVFTPYVSYVHYGMGRNGCEMDIGLEYMIDYDRLIEYSKDSER